MVFLDYKDVLLARKKLRTDCREQLSTLEQLAAQKNYGIGGATNGEDGFGLYIDFYYLNSRDRTFERELETTVTELLGNSFENIPIYTRFVEPARALQN